MQKVVIGWLFNDDLRARGQESEKKNQNVCGKVGKQHHNLIQARGWESENPGLSRPVNLPTILGRFVTLKRSGLKYGPEKADSKKQGHFYSKREEADPKKISGRTDKLE